MAASSVEQIGLLEAVDNGAAEFLGVADGFHEEGVLGHAGDAAEIDDAAHGDDDVIEADDDGGGVHPGIEGEGFAREIDFHDAAAQDIETCGRGSGWD